jgi:hypothetical protein
MSTPQLRRLQRVLTWREFNRAALRLATALKGIDASGVYGPPRGGLPLAVVLSHLLKLPYLTEQKPGMLWVDDIVDTGKTLHEVQGARACAAWFSRLPRLDVTVAEVCKGDEWLVFPWEPPSLADIDAAAYCSSRGLVARAKQICAPAVVPVSPRKATTRRKKPARREATRAQRKKASTPSQKAQTRRRGA